MNTTTVKALNQRVRRGLEIQLRREVVLDGRKCVVVDENKKRITVEPLDGDFSDYRKLLGLSQVEFASKLGISQTRVSCYELNQETPPEAIIAKCKALIKQAGAKKAKASK